MKNDLCEECPVGSWNNRTDQSACTECPGGGSTPGNGTVSQDQCSESEHGGGREDLPQGTGQSHRTSVVSQGLGREGGSTPGNGTVSQDQCGESGPGEGGRIYPREWDSLTGPVW